LAGDSTRTSFAPGKEPCFGFLMMLIDMVDSNINM